MYVIICKVVQIHTKNATWKTTYNNYCSGKAENTYDSNFKKPKIKFIVLLGKFIKMNTFKTTFQMV